MLVARRSASYDAPSPLLVTDLPASLLLGLAFVLGATWGSFFNVAIYRWPRDMSVVTPPSTCPACGARIPPARNVPILAYLLQRGRAACCGAKLTPRYVVVEILSALLAVALAQRFIVRAEDGTLLATAGLETATWFVFVGGLIVATFVDLEWLEIPDEVTMGGTALGLATVSLRPGLDPAEAALGAGIGFLSVQLVLVWAWERWTGRRGMGEGDSKLMMLIGVFLGWRGALFSLVAGALQGLLAVGIGQVLGRPVVAAPSSPAPNAAPSEENAAMASEGDAAANEAKVDADAGGESADAASPKIPFGPFLALAAIEFLFFGETILDWYADTFL